MLIFAIGITVKRAIIIGASGLIGSHLIRTLLADKRVEEVVALVRKPLELTSPRLSQHVVDFDNEQTYSNFVFGDALFCCLGTTKSKSPDPAMYRKVDLEYPLAVARIASANQVAQFHLISALGADSQSLIFYSRLKGELETGVKKLNFKGIYIYQPSLLDGSRAEARPMEKIGIAVMRVINPILVGPLSKYRSIKAETVAKAMAITAHKNLDGVYVYPSDKIKEII